jgi:hypothetical protein
MEGGVLHPARRIIGGGSGAWQSSTELLRPEEEEDPNRYAGRLQMGWLLGCVAGLRPGNPALYFFLTCSFSFLLYFLFCLSKLNSNLLAGF